VGSLLRSRYDAPLLRARVCLPSNDGALAGIVRVERILDVGCGPGRLAISAGTVAGQAGEVGGIDPAPEIVELAGGKVARAGEGASRLR